MHKMTLQSYYVLQETNLPLSCEYVNLISKKKNGETSLGGEELTD